MVDTEKARSKAQQLKGKVEQSVGKATGSEKTQDRGKIDEAKGTIREKTADVKGKVMAAIRVALAIREVLGFGGVARLHYQQLAPALAPVPAARRRQLRRGEPANGLPFGDDDEVWLWPRS